MVFVPQGRKDGRVKMQAGTNQEATRHRQKPEGHQSTRGVFSGRTGRMTADLIQELREEESWMGFYPTAELDVGGAFLRWEQ